MSYFLVSLVFFVTFFAQKHIADMDTIYELTDVYFTNGNWKILTNPLDVYKEERLESKYSFILNKNVQKTYSVHAVFYFDSTSFMKNQLLYRQWHINSASEVYLNGKPILINGRISKNINDEMFGSYYTYTLVPETSVKNGLNVLSILVSNQHDLGEPCFGVPSFMTYSNYNSYDVRWNREVVLVLSILLFSVIISIILYTSLGKNKSYLFFAASCFFLSTKLLFKIIISIINADVYTAQIFINMMDYSYALGDGFLVFFLLNEVDFHKKFLLGFLAIILSFLTIFFIHNTHLTLIIGFSLYIAIKGIQKGHENSKYYLVGLIALSICSYLGYEEKLSWGYFIGVIVFISSIFFASARQILLNNQKYHETKMRSIRLENQMLKKNIQPHFLMNSLVSLQQLAKEDHKKAIQMIDALADEFHLFSKASEKKLIPLKDELEICKAHLKIMEFRKDAKFELQTENITGEEQIPPAIFHTLIENGISHGYAFKDEGMFQLRKTENNRYIEFQLYNDGEVETVNEKRKNGTGTKYIKARLTESYGDKWEISCGPVQNGYLSKIRILKS